MQTGEKWCWGVPYGWYDIPMDAQIASGIIGIIFLSLCIGFLSFMQPSPRQASEHPFLNPQVASVGEGVYLNEQGTFSIGRNDR